MYKKKIRKEKKISLDPSCTHSFDVAWQHFTPTLMPQKNRATKQPEEVIGLVLTRVVGVSAEKKRA